jgi:hypothetical protein
VYDAFVSYARKDTGTVERLVSALKERWPAIELAVDTEAILPAEQWADKIGDLIDSSLCVLFVVSPSSITSIECGREVEKAEQRNKRVVPVVVEAVDVARVPKAVAAFNFIDLVAPERFEKGVDDVVLALRLDSEWRREHTQLLMRARDWNDGGRDRGGLLRGRDLRSAIARWQAIDGLDPKPTALQSAFVAESEKEDRRRSRNRRAGWGAGAMFVLAVLGWLGWALATTPTHAWMQTDLQSREVVDAAIIDQGHAPRIAIQAAYHVGSMDDDSGGRAEIRMLELDLAGRVLDCAAYPRDEGGVGTPARCNDFPSSGGLVAKLVGAGLGSDELGDEAPDPWSVLAPSGPGNERIDAARDVQETAQAWIQALRESRREAAPKLEDTKVFCLGRTEWIVFATVSRGYEQAGTLTAITGDDGRTWRVSPLLNQLTASGMSDVTRSGAGLFATALDSRVPGSSDGTLGGVFFSSDGGASWRRVELMAPLDDWGAFYSVRASAGNPSFLAVASAPDTRTRSRPDGVPGVLLSEDGGASWKRLADGLSVPSKSLIRIAGVSARGEVVAVVYQDDQQSVPSVGKPRGRVTVWRPLSVLERLRMNYGVAFSFVRLLRGRRCLRCAMAG